MITDENKYEDLIHEAHELTSKIVYHKHSSEPDSMELFCMEQAIRQLYNLIYSLETAKDHTNAKNERTPVVDDVLARVECGTSTAADADYLRKVLP